MRKYIAGVLTAGVLFCALRWADLALWTDRETGLVTAGPVWARYLILAALAGLALLAGHGAAGSAGKVSCPRSRKAALALSVPAFAAGALYLAQGVLDLLGAAGVPALAHGALEVLCALWLECLGQFWLLAGLRSQRRASAPPPALLGVLGSLVFVWDVLASFMTNGSSWHRTIPTAAVWQALAALLLLAAVLRAVCLPGAASPRACAAAGCWPGCSALPGRRPGAPFCRPARGTGAWRCWGCWGACAPCCAPARSRCGGAAMPLDDWLKLLKILE